MSSTFRNRVGLERDETESVLSVVALVLAVIFPLGGLPLSLMLRRRARENGRENELARVAMLVSIVILALGAVLLVIGFVTAVIFPLAGIQLDVSP